MATENQDAGSDWFQRQRHRPAQGDRMHHVLNLLASAYGAQTVFGCKPKFDALECLLRWSLVGLMGDEACHQKMRCEVHGASYILPANTGVSRFE